MTTTAILGLALLLAAPQGGAGQGKEPAAKVFPEVAGWRMTSEPARYTSANLFEYVDGAADAFFQFDFEELLTTSYGNRDKAEITVDVYRHRNATRAFGMYTQERPSASTAIPVGIEGTAGADHLEFVAGPYYVKMALAGSKDASLLRPFAEKIAAKLPGSRTPPSVLKCFPDKGKRPRAEKLAAHDFLGHAFLHDAVAVPYQIDGVAFRLFAIEAKDEADVRHMVERYRALAKLPAAPVKSAGNGTLKDPLNGEVVLHWGGHWLWGAVDGSAPGRPALLDELGRNLMGLTK